MQTHRGEMMRGLLLLGLLLLANLGCQCCGVTEFYQDQVDCIADSGCTLDRFYRPGLDLTRICCHRCAMGNYAPGYRACPPTIYSPHHVARTETKASIEQTPQVETIQQPSMSESKPVVDEIENENQNEIEWIHFEPLPALEPEVTKPEPVVELFEAPDPVIAPVIAPLSIKPRPFR